MHGFMSYGHWDICEGIPVMTHYLEPAVRSKRVQLFERKDEDLFKVQAAPVSCYHNSDLMKKRAGEKQHRTKQGRVCTYVNRKPKAVDEDLYRVPPELLYQIPKKKRVLSNFLYGCLGLNCIA